MTATTKLTRLPRVPHAGQKTTLSALNQERTNHYLPIRDRPGVDATPSSTDSIPPPSEAKRSVWKRRLKDVAGKQPRSSAPGQSNVPVRRFVLGPKSVQRVCKVETILRDRFTATFREPGKPVQRVRFDISIVSPNDLPLLQVGATFYWCMGYRQDNDGDRAYVSFLRFRRFPRLSEKQVEAARQRAVDIAAAGGWDLLTNKEVDEELARSGKLTDR